MKIIVIDEEEKKSLIRMYFYGITTRELKRFSKKQGYGDDFMAIHFKEYLEEDPYEFQQELSEIKDNQVLLWARYPAISEKNSETNVYLNFDEFYGYLEESVNERIAETPSDKAEYEQLLSEVKIALGL
ncbi:hypothetical protein FACS1894192_03850 [Bacilli bacterium]|nr:hypothetical protein FACS1894192_03850 [Bacilli bacterium]